MDKPLLHALAASPRRCFLQSLAALGASGALGGGLPAWAQQLPAAHTGTPPELRGTEFDLVIDATRVDFDGRAGIATTVNGSLPGPTLRMREGDTVTIRVTNRLRETSSIHWHGILLPFQMDGVPGVSFAGIAPGETFTYRFTLRQSGTYWYHSHSAMHELTGLYGALIVEPRGGETLRADREHVLLLSDWTGDDPMRVLTRLKAESHQYNQHKPTLAQLLHDARRDGWAAARTRRCSRPRAKSRTGACTHRTPNCCGAMPSRRSGTRSLACASTAATGRSAPGWPSACRARRPTTSPRAPPPTWAAAVARR